MIKFFKRLFCKHKNKICATNIYGDFINALNCRSIWVCKDCGKEIKSDKLEPSCRNSNFVSIDNIYRDSKFCLSDDIGMHEEYGDLYFKDILVYYDMPLIFSLYNDKNELFLCYLESDYDLENIEEKHKEESYILSKINMKDYIKFLNNEITIYKMLVNSSSNLITINNDDIIIENLKEILVLKLKKLNLPDRNEYLN